VRGPFGLLLDKKSMYKRADELVKDLKVNISSPKLKVAQMSVGSARWLPAPGRFAFQSKILIMDEPTAALGVTEANSLLNLIKNLKDIGLSILLITQRIPDVLAIADRVMVLKGGQRQDIMDVKKLLLTM